MVLVSGTTARSAQACRANRCSWLSRLLAAVLIFGGYSSASWAATTQPQNPSFWLAPKSPYPPAHILGMPDLMDMFKIDAPWTETSKHIQVLQMPTQFMAWVPDDVLATIVNDLKRRGIALAIASLSQSTKGQPRCGQNVEGYSNPAITATIASKIRRVGGVLSYVALDEPLFFGHFYNSATACHSSVENVAERVGAIIAEYRKVFPNVIVGDIEPAGAALIPGWNSAFVDWVRAFRSTAGTPLQFLRIDVPWNSPTHIDALRKSAALARQSNLTIGVVYNGKDNDPTDAQWTADAKANIRNVEDVLGGAPPQIVFQSWAAHPEKLLPESDPVTLTGLVKYYIDTHPKIR